MLISRSWSTFGMAGWSFCQGRIGRDCVQPFSMFSLQVSGCFRGAQKQLCNSQRIIASWWRDEDILFTEVLFISRCLPSAETVSRPCDWNASPVFWIIATHGSVATSVFIVVPTDTELSMQSEGEWFLLSYSTLLLGSFTIMPHCIWDSVKRKEHILLNWHGLFFWLSEHFVIQLFFGDNSFNINSVCVCFFSFGIPCQKLLLYIVKVEDSQHQNRQTAPLGFKGLLILMWGLQVQGVGGGGNLWWIIAFSEAFISWITSCCRSCYIVAALPQKFISRGRSWNEINVFFCLISKIQTERELRKNS